MDSFLLFACASVGLTYILLEGNVFGLVKGLRDRSTKFEGSNLHELFTCPQCMGTWCGFLCGFMMFTDFRLGILSNLFTVLLSGFASSFLCIVFDNLRNLVWSLTCVDGGPPDEKNPSEKV